jgi:hypothetical protein
MDSAATFVHLFGVLLWVAGTGLVFGVYEAARRQQSLHSTLALLAVARMAALVIIAATCILLAGGIWLAHENKAWSEPWLQASIVLFAAVVVLGALGGQCPKRARILATRIIAEENTRPPGVILSTSSCDNIIPQVEHEKLPRDASSSTKSPKVLADVHHLLSNPFARAANYATVGIIVTILALMVWRPGS